MHSVYSPRMNVAIDAVRTAARQVRKKDLHRGDLRISYKKPGDMVTNADLASEALVLECLEESYPNDGYLSEERGSSGDMDRCWVLDPIDGTTNFVHGMPEYTISLAWCQGGEPQLGVIYDICRDEIYAAEKGKGARCNERRIRVSGTSKLSEALIASTGSTGRRDSWRWEFLEQASRRTHGFRRIGSGTLDFALTARGSFDAAFGARLHYWDYAAGSVILKEAGGVFSDLEGNATVEFGSRLGFCLYGSPRIAGSLRRLALKCQAEHAQD